MSLVLATDLDGTFLGGSVSQRAALYDWLAKYREHITLIFVTGRGLGFVRELRDMLPAAARPDHVVANVGTTAATGPELLPIADVEAWLDAGWRSDAPAIIDALLAEHTHLEPQPVVEGRRKSYFYRDSQLAEQTRVVVEQAGFDTLLSDNVYFDVLPRGVRKGPTLLRVLAALHIARNDVLVAGDTLNDLSLFETGLRGVAVGNSEAALKQAVREMDHVQKSPEPGASGVLHALREFAAVRGIV